jgi:tetratricopeptide (TPR) repeat protein
VADASRRGDRDEVIRTSRRLQQLRVPEGYLYDAYLRGVEDHHEEALALLKKGLAINPKSAALWNELARCNIRMQRHRDGEAALAKAVEVGGNPIESAITLSVLRVAQDRADDALATLRELDLTNADLQNRLEVHVQMAWIYELGAQYNDVLTLLEPFTDLAGTDSLVHSRKLIAESVAWYFGRSDAAKAMDLARQAFEVEPRNPQALEMMFTARNLFSDTAQVFRVIAVGGASRAFAGSYQVVANDPEQAFLFIQELEVSEVAATLSLVKAERQKSGSGLPLGVAEIESRNFYE